MSHVGSLGSQGVTRWLALDVHKLSIVAAVLPEDAGEPELVEIENTERSVRRLVARLGGPVGLACCYEAGPCGYDLYRLFEQMGVSCEVVAPSLTPVRPGDRVKTDRRDARKLAGLFRAGQLTFCTRLSRSSWIFGGGGSCCV